MTPERLHSMIRRRSRWRMPMMLAVTVLTGGSLMAAANVPAGSARHDGPSYFRPGNLLVSGSVYNARAVNLVPGVTVLPPGCTSGCATASNGGTFPQVWDNALVDGSFGITSPSRKPESAQDPGLPTPVGSFNITQLGDPADKIGKDTNFRGLTIFHNVLYYTKGSGGNGVNTVYFLDTTGHACPNGAGVPQPGAKLPTAPIAYNPVVLQTAGVQPYNMCILQGFPAALKSKTAFPFGVWFANAGTLYVADEGNGDTTYSTASGAYTGAAAQATAGLQKWVRENGTWKLAYTLNDGLALGVPYTVPGYPAGNNPATGLPWAPATDGLRNITGRVNPDGTVTIWAITSTVSGDGDQGADPNKLVTITDQLAATAPGAESFATERTAGFGQVLRGVSFTPGTRASN
jgi:hypothetical protein